MSEPVVAWITKYALSTGIVCNDFTVCDWINKDVVRVGRFGPYYHGEGREWHRTRESAVKKANEMRLKKIASLKKKITSLEALDFEKDAPR